MNLPSRNDKTNPDDPVALPDEPTRHPWIWLVYVVLFGLSIPWYLPRSESPAIWFGFPYWVVLSLAATAGIAAFTAFVFHRYWVDEEDSQ